MILPLPSEEIKKALEGKKRIIDIEDNFSGQLGQVIKEKTGIAPNFHILKYTGRAHDYNGSLRCNQAYSN